MTSFESIVAERLGRFRRGVNVLSYEGTLGDRICYQMARRTWRREDFTVICSVRPCMLPELVTEVRAFARENVFALADFQGDCSARYRWLEQPRSCENVSALIRERLAFSEGLFVSSALLNSVNDAAFQEVNRERSDLYLFESPELARFRHPTDGRDWRTLFLLQGFGAADLIAAYLTFVSSDLTRRHFPVCYLNCYHEETQRRMIELLPQLVPELTMQASVSWTG